MDILVPGAIFYATTHPRPILILMLKTRGKPSLSRLGHNVVTHPAPSHHNPKVSKIPSRYGTGKLLHNDQL